MIDCNSYNYIARKIYSTSEWRKQFRSTQLAPKLGGAYVLQLVS